MSVQIIVGDARTEIANMPAASVQMCVTSPPYFNLRDYGMAGQIGLEKTPDEFVAELVAVFREVRRVLKDDGVLWVNIGDSYASSSVVQSTPNARGGRFGSAGGHGRKEKVTDQITTRRQDGWNTGCKPKDLIGIPWMLAFALRADGWYLRSDVIWAKPNPMPESVADRCTSAHEHVFMLTKNARYFYDAEAVAETAKDWTQGGPGTGILNTTHYGAGNGGNNGLAEIAARYKAGVAPTTRNRRNVWTIATQPFIGSHFATMPPDLAEICILAGSKPGDTILDPFGGAGTSGLVADRLGRNAVLIELNPEFATMARNRIHDDAPLLSEVTA